MITRWHWLDRVICWLFHKRHREHVCHACCRKWPVL
jgi:hypothetical protein